MTFQLTLNKSQKSIQFSNILAQLAKAIDTIFGDCDIIPDFIRILDCSESVQYLDELSRGIFYKYLTENYARLKEDKGSQVVDFEEILGGHNKLVQEIFPEKCEEGGVEISNPLYTKFYNFGNFLPELFDQYRTDVEDYTLAEILEFFDAFIVIEDYSNSLFEYQTLGYQKMLVFCHPVYPPLFVAFTCDTCQIQSNFDFEWAFCKFPMHISNSDLWNILEAIIRSEDLYSQTEEYRERYVIDDEQNEMNSMAQW